MILQRRRSAERAHDRRRVIFEAAYSRIGCTEIEQASATGFVLLQSFCKTVGFQVPVGARGKHQMSYIRFSYRMTLLSFSIAGPSSCGLLSTPANRSPTLSNRRNTLAM